MSKETTSQIVDRIGKDFMGLPQNEALLVLLTAATYYVTHYIPASEFDDAWEEMGRTVFATGRKMAPIFLSELEGAGHA